MLSHVFTFVNTLNYILRIPFPLEENTPNTREKAVDFFPFLGYNNRAKYASVAQSVVHLTRNEKVACSSHVTSSKISHPIRGGLFWLYRDVTRTFQCGADERRLPPSRRQHLNFHSHRNENVHESRHCPIRGGLFWLYRDVTRTFKCGADERRLLPSRRQHHNFHSHRNENVNESRHCPNRGGLFGLYWDVIQ